MDKTTSDLNEGDAEVDKGASHVEKGFSNSDEDASDVCEGPLRRGRAPLK